MDNKLNITAKLTSKGKETFFLRGLQGVVTKFSLGDSDTNYKSNESLPYVYEYGSNGSDTVFDNVLIKDLVSLDVTGTSFKIIEQSNSILSSKYISEQKNIGIDKYVVIENDVENKMLGLPITDAEKTKHKNSITESLNNEKFLVVKIDDFGEVINGVDFKIVLNEFEIYSAYNSTLTDLDKTLFDYSSDVLKIGNNTVLLFSDAIKPPKGDTEKSWSTGWRTFKPYTKNNKSTYYFDEKDLNISDKMVGYVLLDKGIVIITNNTIIESFEANADKNIEVGFTTEKLSIYQEYICQINRGEFTISKNSTYTSGDIVKVTEIGLYDRMNTLIAYAKLNKQLEITGIQPITISIVFEI